MALSKTSKWVTLVVGLLVVSPFAYDLGRRLTHTGIYRSDCQGTVLETGPTLFGVVNFFDCSGSDRDRRRRKRVDRRSQLRGHYAAKIDDDRSNRVYKVSISGDDFNTVRAGQYVVCHDGAKTFYKSKADYLERSGKSAAPAAP